MRSCTLVSTKFLFVRFCVAVSCQKYGEQTLSPAHGVAWFRFSVFVLLLSIVPRAHRFSTTASPRSRKRSPGRVSSSRPGRAPARTAGCRRRSTTRGFRRRTRASGACRRRAVRTVPTCRRAWTARVPCRSCPRPTGAARSWRTTGRRGS